MSKTETKMKNQKLDRDREIVTGRFQYYEVPGGELSFTFRKYKEDRVERYSMKDGEVYRVPRSVATHLAKECWYPVHHYKIDDSGKPSQDIGQKKKRFDFIPIDFIMEPDAGDKQLVTVRNL